jgi:hypothetical protein
MTTGNERSYVYTTVKCVFHIEQKSTIMKHDLSSNKSPRRTTVIAGQKANTRKKRSYTPLTPKTSGSGRARQAQERIETHRI